MEIKKLDNNRIEIEGAQIPLFGTGKNLHFLWEIPVKDLELDKEAQPRPYNPKSAEKIAESVRNKVLMQPILVRYKEGKFFITEGQHRWRAIKDILKRERIPCIVYIDMNNVLALECGIEANAEDRARALSGGDLAQKTLSTVEEAKKSLSKAKNIKENEVTESDIFFHLHWDTYSKIKKYLLAWKTELLITEPRARIGNYIAPTQTSEKPLTVKNFMFFLKHLIKTDLVPEVESDIKTGKKKKVENLRKDEFENLVKVTNYIVKFVLTNWNLEAKTEEEIIKHEHVKRICKRHPFEALGVLIDEVIVDCGGKSKHPLYVKTNEIDWKEFEKKIKNLLNSDVWDDYHVFYQRSIDEIIDFIEGKIRISKL